MPALPQQPGQEQQPSPLVQVAQQAPPAAMPQGPLASKAPARPAAQAPTAPAPTPTAPAQAGQQQAQMPDWQAALPAIAERHGVDPELLRRLVQAESAGDPSAADYKTGTHKGLGQLSPALVKQYGIDPNDPLQNLGVSASEISRLLKKYNNNYGRAIAAYNAGEGVMDKLPMGQLPQNGETPQYVLNVLKGYQPPFQTAQPGQAPVGTPTMGPQPLGGGAAGTRYAGIADIGQRILRMLGAGAPAGSEMARLTGQEGVTDPEQMRLLAPEQLMSMQQQQAHPALRAAGEFAGGMTTPQNALLMPMLGGLGEVGAVTRGMLGGKGILAETVNAFPKLAAMLPRLAPRAAALGISLPMLQSAYENYAPFAHAVEMGDSDAAWYHFTHGVLGAIGGAAGLEEALSSHPAIATRLQGRTPEPSIRETPAAGAVAGAPQAQAQPAEVQVAPRQESTAVGQEGGPQQITQAGVTGAQEVTGRTQGDTVASAASAPIERGGVSGGAPSQDIRTQGAEQPRAAGPGRGAQAGGLGAQVSEGTAMAPLPSTAGPAPMPRAGEPEYQTAPSTAEDVQRKIGQARQAGLMPDLRKTAGPLPAEGERRRQQQEVIQSAVLDQLRGELTRARTPEDKARVQRNIADLEEMQREQAAGVQPATAPVPVPAPAPAQQPTPAAPAVAEGERGAAAMAIMRDPALYQKFRTADRKTQQQMLIEAARSVKNAQGQTGVAQAQAPTATAANQQPVRAAQIAAGAPREPIQPRQEPVRQPASPTQVAPRVAAQAGTKPAPKPYQPLPAEQRPRMSVEQLRAQREGREAPPQAAPAPRAPVEIPTPTPRPEKAMAPEVEAWKETRRQEAGERAQAMAQNAQGREPAADARSVLHKTVDRALKMEGRDWEIARDVETVKKQGPEAVKAAQQEFETKAGRAEKMADWGRKALDKGINEWDLEMRERSGAIQHDEQGRVAGEMRFTGKTTEEGRKEVKPAVVRDISPEKAEMHARLRGNKLKEAGTRRELNEEGQAKLKAEEDKRDRIIDDIRKRNKRPPEHVLADLENTIRGIQGLTGIQHIAVGGPELARSPEGALESTGTRTSQAMWNAFMGRPEGMHAGKPSTEQVQARVAQLEREGKVSRSVLEQLGGKAAEGAVQTGERPRAAEGKTPLTSSVAKAPVPQEQPNAESLVKFFEESPTLKGKITPESVRAVSALHDKIGDTEAREQAAQDVLKAVKAGNITPQEAVNRYGKALQAIATGLPETAGEAKKAPQLAEQAGKEAPSKVDVKSLLEAAGLRSKGQFGDSSLHEVEDPKFPGHTMTVDFAKVPDTGAVKYLRDRMNAKLQEFREKPSELKTEIPTEASKASAQLAREGSKPEQERTPKQPEQFGLPTEAQARELKEVRALIDKGDLQGALSRVRKLHEAGEIEHPLDMGDWKGWPTGRLVTALENYLETRVQGKSHKEGIEAIWRRLGRPAGSATSFEGIEDPLKSRAATTSEKSADTERQALLKRIAELEAQAAGKPVEPAKPSTAAEKPAAKPKPEARKPQGPVEELEHMVGVGRPQPSAEAIERYDAARREVHEEFAKEAKEYLDKKKEVQQMRSVEPKDYSPAFLDRMERYGKGLKEPEGQSEYLAKVLEARTALEGGDRRAVHAAVQSALAMADGRLIKPEPGKMPVKPSAGWYSSEPAKASKVEEPRERLQKLGARIEKLPAGEDKENLQRGHATVQNKFEDFSKQIEDLNERIKWTTQAIRQMEKRGETSRQFTTKEGKKGVQTIEQARKNLSGMETQRMLLGRDRQELVRDQLPRLADTISAFEKAPVPKPAAEPATELGPTKAEVYGQVQPVYDQWGRKIGKEAPKLGEKEVQPAAPVAAEGVQGKIDELQSQRNKLANYIKEGWGSTGKANELRKSIRRIEGELGIKAPAPKPETKAVLEGENLLRAAGRTEKKTAPAGPKYSTFQPVDDPAGELAEKLVGAGLEPGQLHDQIEKSTNEGAKKGREMIARPIMDAINEDKIEPLDAQGRYQQALKLYTDRLRMEQKNPDLPRIALRRAVEYARTGVIPEYKPGELGKPGEAGFIGRSPFARQPVSAAGQAMKRFMQRVSTKGREIAASMERNREAQNLFNRKADMRQMRKADVMDFYLFERDLQATPEMRAKIYNYREEQNLPADRRKIELTPYEHRINDWVTSLIKDNVRIRQKLGKSGFTDEEILGLTHRVPVGKGGTYEQWLEGALKVGPGKPLSTFASSMQRSKYIALEDGETGERMVVRMSKKGHVYAYGAGQQLGADIGLASEYKNAGFKFKRATSDEIESATGKKYYRDAIGPNIAEAIAMRGAERAHDFAEKLKEDPEFQRMSTTNADVAKAMGFRAADAGKDSLGKNREWLPQFKGYYFEPHVAEVMEKEYKRFQQGDFAAYERMNNWLKRSIFWNPLMHTPNITVHWQGEKGLTGMATQFFSPAEWRAHQKAFDVMTDPVKYHDMLMQGLPLMREPNMNDVTKLFVGKAAGEVGLAPSNSKLDRLAKSLGYINGREMAKKVLNPFRGASEITWATHDYAILQATFSRMEKHGWDLKTAADEVTKHIPNYRMPPRVWNSRLLGAVMDAPGISMFSQYHYGAFKSYAEMTKELVRPLKPGDRFRAVDRMAALGLITYVLYPQADKLAKYITGRSDAAWRRAGSSTFVYNVGKVFNSLTKSAGPKMGVLPFAESVVSPAPLISAGIKAAGSKELTQKGQPLIGTPMHPGVAYKAGQIAAETIGAVAGYESGKLKPKSDFNWREFLYRAFGGRDETEGTVSQGRSSLPKLPRTPRLH